MRITESHLRRIIREELQIIETMNRAYGRAEDMTLTEYLGEIAVRALEDNGFRDITLELADIVNYLLARVRERGEDYIATFKEEVDDQLGGHPEGQLGDQHHKAIRYVISLVPENREAFYNAIRQAADATRTYDEQVIEPMRQLQLAYDRRWPAPEEHAYERKARKSAEEKANAEASLERKRAEEAQIANYYRRMNDEGRW